jgi:hypothetical protein
VCGGGVWNAGQAEPQGDNRRQDMVMLAHTAYCVVSATTGWGPAHTPMGPHAASLYRPETHGITTPPPTHLVEQRQWPQLPQHGGQAQLLRQHQPPQEGQQRSIEPRGVDRVKPLRSSQVKLWGGGDSTRSQHQSQNGAQQHSIEARGELTESNPLQWSMKHNRKAVQGDPKNRVSQRVHVRPFDTSLHAPPPPWPHAIHVLVQTANYTHTPYLLLIRRPPPPTCSSHT